MQLGGGFESDGVVGALLPTELRVERMVLGLNGVAEGEEKLAQIVGAQRTTAKVTSKSRGCWTSSGRSLHLAPRASRKTRFMATAKKLEAA